MRRNDREITDPGRIREILEKSVIIHLGLMDGTYPYVLPLHYGFEFSGGKLVFYMHGAREGYKLDLIRQNPHAGFAVDCEVEQISGNGDPCMYSSYFASVMGKGRVSVVEDIDEKIHGLQVLMETQTKKTFAFDERMANAVCVIKLTCDSFSAKSRAKMPQ